MNPVVNLTAKAVQEINEILSRGKGVEIAVEKRQSGGLGNRQ